MIASQVKVLINGQIRPVQVLRPGDGSGDPHEWPLVLLFHGGGSNPQGVIWESRFDELVDARGIQVAALTGSPLGRRGQLQWNDGRELRGGGRWGVDDVAYVRTFLETWAATNCDQSRIYAAGYSNGAFLAYRLAQALSYKLAAVGAVAGQRGAHELLPPNTDGRRPVSMIHFAGKRDRIIPYQGGTPSGILGAAMPFMTNLLPVRDALRTWAEYDGCTAWTASGSLSQWGPSAAGDRVHLWSLADGGHTWPGGRCEMPILLGGVSQQVWAAEAMVDFFLEHRR